jgi:hypothetical protein
MNCKLDGPVVAEATAAYTPPSTGVVRITPTQLLAWTQCPLSCRLRYIEGHTPPTSPALFLGTVVRTALCRLHAAERDHLYLSKEDLKRFVMEQWADLAARGGVQFSTVLEERTLRQQACSLVDTYQDNREWDEPRALAVAQPVIAPLLMFESSGRISVCLSGTLDLVVDSPTGPVLVEFRTSSRSASQGEVQEEIRLACQALLFRHWSGAQEAGQETRRLIKTKTPQLQRQRWPVRAEVHFRRLAAVVRAFLADDFSGQHIYRPSLACSWCDYRESSCRDWLVT